MKVTREDKYYTPSIEEFHKGFEYEVFQKGQKPEPGVMYLMGIETEDKWFPFKYPDPFVGYRLDKMFENYKMRVRHINQKDIEDLGFEWISKLTLRTDQFENDKLLLFFNREDNIVSVADKNPRTVIATQLFRGTCKNRIKLIEILKIIEIN